MSCIAYQLRMTHTPPWVWVILIHSHSFSCTIITHTVSCMSYNVYQPMMTPTPSLNMSDSHSSSVILIQYHACRIMHIGLEWPPPLIEYERFSVTLSHPHTVSSMSCIVCQHRMTTTPSLNMSDSQSSSVILMHSILSHSHAFSSQTCSFMLR